MTRYDAIVIGAGQAGPSLAVRLADAGRRVALIERHKLGGTCVNTGCTPTKTFVASAYVAHLCRRAADFGVAVEGATRIDMKQVKARKDAVVNASVGSLDRWLHERPNLDLHWGHARFVGPRTVAVGDLQLEAGQIFINVGGRPSVPELPGVDSVPYLDSDAMMNIDTLPAHLIVVGGSYVGLEYAQMFRRFGSEVSVVEMGPRLIGREDAEVSDAVAEILRDEGIAIRTQAKCVALHRAGEGVAVSVDCAEGAPKVEGTHVLLAVGRTPNTDDLGLDRAGIEVNERGFIDVNDQLETTQHGVYALGDCNGRGAFTHTAYNDYEVVADNLLGKGLRSVKDRVSCYGLFIDPPLGRVGMSESEARQAGHKLLIGRRPMSRVARAREKSETQGFIKIVVDAESNRILGAAILGLSGDEVVHSLLDAMYAKLPYTAVRRGVRIHPTVSELIPTVLGELSPA